MVCGRCGLAGNFRDSHIVAFLEKVMVVRDASVLAHCRIPLSAAEPQIFEQYIKDRGTLLTLSSDINMTKENVFDPSAWISQAKAAQLRGVSRQAIAELVKKNRFKTIKIGGKILLDRLDVESYQAKLPGREPKRGRKKQHRPTLERRKSTETTEKHDYIEKLISQSEAARLRGVSKQAITSLISRGRLTSVDVAGHTLVLRSEIESFVVRPKGHPPKKAIGKKKSQNAKPKSKA